MALDKVDREILSEIQRDGRQSLTALAERLRVSLSSVHRRLRSLESSGAVRGYRADVDPAAVGLGFDTLVFVTLRQEDRVTVAEFEAAVVAIPNVVQAQRLFGDPDYLLRIVTEDLDAYQQLYDGALGALPGVQRLSSTIVMKRLVEHRPLPL